MNPITLEKLLSTMPAEKDFDRPGILWSPSVTDRDSLELPGQPKEPHHILVGRDLFHESVPDEFLGRVFDAMWLCSQHTFWVLSPNVERMVEYTRYQHRSFGWTDLGRRPMKPGDYHHIETLYCRNECGYRHDGKDKDGERLDWACEHPGNDERLENCSCHRHSCPIAGCADSQYQLEAIDVIDDYDEFYRADSGELVGENDEQRSDDYVEDTGWMELHSRPRNAMCGNVWLGFSAPDQQSFGAGARRFRLLRGDPHQKLFCYIAESIDLNIPHHGEGEPDDFQWSPLEKCRFSHGGEEVFRPYLDGIVTDKSSLKNEVA